ncbi:MAG: transcriptional activator NhaR [bacterium]
MEWLNYHHLYYFYTVAKEGGLAPAARKLLLSQPAISGQIRTLERSLGERLFARSGRRLTLTEAGQGVYRYAEEIFSLGQELVDSLRGRPGRGGFRLVVGVADVVPKSIAYRLLEPVFRLPEKIQILCREDRPERLIAELALHQLDLVISDAPLSPWAKVKAFNHELGSSAAAVFGAPALAARYRRGFPKSLVGAPMLLPAPNTALRRSLDAWFEQQELRPLVVGEFEDSALLKAFGQAGQGLFVGPEVVAVELARQYRVKMLGKIPGVREEFYAISAERRLQNPAVLEITRSARKKLF